MPFEEYFRQRRENAAAKSRSGVRALPALDPQHVLPGELAACAEGLQAAADGATSREEAAQRMVGYLFESFRMGESRDPACALVRCFQTHPLAKLPPARRAFAMHQLGAVPFRDDIRCLTMLATRGVEAQWNQVDDSAGHQAIPLPSVEVILKTPMIARLLLQMGIRYEHVVAPPEGGDLMVGAASEALKVFHVERARGSQYIPAQASFVRRYDIQSVLGLGGLTPSGDLVAIVMFTRVPVARETAEQFRALAEKVRAVLVRFPSEQTFAATAA